MEFKEVYKKGLKQGKAISNGEYQLKLKIIDNCLDIDAINSINWGCSKRLVIDKVFIEKKEQIRLDDTRVFLDSFEDNWEVVEEEK